MGFHLSTSNEANELFGIYWSFLREINFLPYCGGHRGAPDYRQMWSVQFDELLRDKSFDLVKGVLLYYINAYKKGKSTFLHRDPQSFIHAFPMLEKQYTYRQSPLSDDEISELMTRFHRYRWVCPDDVLSATVGRSLSVLRRFKGGLAKAKIPQRIRDYIRSRIGYNYSFIFRHFVPKSALPGTVITLKRGPISLEWLYGLTERILQDYGCRLKDVDGYLHSIKEAVLTIN